MIGNARAIATCVIVLGFGSSAAMAQSAGRFGIRVPPVPAEIMPRAKDAAVAATLWDISAPLTGVAFDSVAAA